MQKRKMASDDEEEDPKRANVGREFECGRDGRVIFVDDGRRRRLYYNVNICYQYIKGYQKTY